MADSEMMEWLRVELARSTEREKIARESAAEAHKVILTRALADELQRTKDYPPAAAPDLIRRYHAWNDPDALAAMWRNPTAGQTIYQVVRGLPDVQQYRTARPAGGGASSAPETPEEKARYIRQHGLEAWQHLKDREKAARQRQAGAA